ncbi:hypothetical protein [Micromonospora sonchi]|uniref:hypothetical protein n=1 Tax=Micromonospora sonchi TaxID=1763543 RepID=UPI00166D951E|nr:hypothetical protein [Micromonospora sonchi]
MLDARGDAIARRELFVMPGLLVYLVTLREEAAEQLAELGSATPPASLHKRFTDWVPVRRSA